MIALKAPSGAAVHRIAAQLEPQVRARFLQAIDALQGSVDTAALARALERGDLAGAERVIDLAELPTHLRPMADTLKQIFHAAGDQASQELGTALSESISFSLTNPRAVHAAATLTGRLIREISDATREGIRSLIANGIATGRPPEDTARSIRELVGLTTRQADAVEAYRRELLDAGRSLDDARDAAARYGTQLLNQRARLIARTETIRASAEGQLVAWQQAAADHLLDPARTSRRWTATEDDRLCPICEDLDEQTVPFMAPFHTDVGGVGDLMTPPAHPGCRCSPVLVFS